MFLCPVGFWVRSSGKNFFAHKLPIRHRYTAPTSHGLIGCRSPRESDPPVPVLSDVPLQEQLGVFIVNEDQMASAPFTPALGTVEGVPQRQEFIASISEEHLAL